jgi:hypothetical protein
MLLPKSNIAFLLALNAMGTTGMAMSLKQFFFLESSFNLQIINILSHVHQKNFLVLQLFDESMA